MGLLAGYDLKNNETGRLYGKYSFGNEYYALLDRTRIENELIPIVCGDLKKAGINGSLRDYRIMDVGMGRQAIAFALLGAGSVNHYDISKDHVDRLSRLLEKEYCGCNVVTQNMNLCEAPLPKEHFDFVYLNGIVHHFSHVADGLKNCCSAVRKGGKIWVYFYRSGTFKWFVTSMIRSMLNAEEVDRYFVASALIYDNGNKANYITGRIMDDFFAPYIFLYTPFQYIEYMEKLGFEVCGSNDIDPMSSVNHDCLHHSATLVFERNKFVEISEVDTGELLTPLSEIDQLDTALYRDERPKRSIDLFRKFEKKIKSGVDQVVKNTFLFALHKIAAPQYYGMPELPPDYEKLDQILKLAIEAS